MTFTIAIVFLVTGSAIGAIRRASCDYSDALPPCINGNPCEDANADVKDGTYFDFLQVSGRVGIAPIGGGHPRLGIAEKVSQPTPTGRKIKIKSYFVNSDASADRDHCMRTQLEALRSSSALYDIELSFASYQAVVFHTCTDVTSCMKERPECFPAKKVGSITHPDMQAGIDTTREMIGSWCSRLLLLAELEKEQALYDYFFVFADDVVMDPAHLSRSLYDFVMASNHHWALTAFGTYDVPRMGSTPVSGAPNEDKISGDLPLYSVSLSWGYWGAQAWLLDSHRLPTLSRFYRGLAPKPLDWVPKTAHPLHLGMMSYSTGSVDRWKNVDVDRIVHTDGANCMPMQASGRSPSGLRLSGPVGETGPTNEIIILGMYDTGTNLIYHLQHDNIERPNGIELCKNYSGWAYCGRVWKHTNPKRIAELPKLRLRSGLDDVSEATAIVTVRHPFSLIRSLQKAPYDLDCGDFSVTSPCSYTEPSGKVLLNQQGNTRLPKPICSTASSKRCWPSVVDAWNEYMRGYMELRNFFKKVVFLRYEDIVETPHNTLRHVAEVLQRPLPQEKDMDWTWMNKPSKKANNGVQSLDSAQALEKLHSDDYRANYSDGELREICARLDKHLLFSFGYSGCQDWHGESM